MIQIFVNSTFDIVFINKTVSRGVLDVYHAIPQTVLRLFYYLLTEIKSLPIQE